MRERRWSNFKPTIQPSQPTRTTTFFPLSSFSICLSYIRQSLPSGRRPLDIAILVDDGQAMGVLQFDVAVSVSPTSPTSSVSSYSSFDDDMTDHQRHCSFGRALAARIASPRAGRLSTVLVGILMLVFLLPDTRELFN